MIDFSVNNFDPKRADVTSFFISRYLDKIIALNSTSIDIRVYSFNFVESFNEHSLTQLTVYNIH